MNRQEYLLTCLAEEAAEIIQAVGKAQRFGLEDDFFDESPKDAIFREFTDFIAVFEMLFGEDSRTTILFSGEEIEAKKQKVEKYMEYSKERGTLI